MANSRQITTYDAPQFWGAIDAELDRRGGGPATQDERRYLLVRKRLRLYQEADDERDRRDAVDDAAEDIVALRAAGLSTSFTDLDMPADARWKTITALEKATGGDEAPEPVVRVSAARPVGFYTGEAPPPLRQEVTVIFDNRVPYRLLARLLRNSWPEFKKKGIVRQTRPLGDRKAALARFVCVEMPTASWRERFTAWNKQHPNWAYGKRAAMITALHDAEESLTGERHGLAWFYEAKARFDNEALKALDRQGDSAARRELERRKAEGIRRHAALGIGFSERSKSTKVVARRGTRPRPPE